MKNTKITISYILIHAIFWCSYAITWSYTAVYLKSCGYESVTIGYVTGIGAIGSVLLQPLLVSIVSKYNRINTTKCVVIIKLISVLLTVGIIVNMPGRLSIAILFCLLATFDASIPSMLSSIAMEYINVNVEVNYGLARGIGSISYAVFSYALGYMINYVGEGILMFLYVGLSVIVIFVMRLLPNSPRNHQVNCKKKKNTVLQLMKDYKFLKYFLIASILIFMEHSMMNMFLINIIQGVGGNNTSLGTALFIAAATELPVMALFAVVVRKISDRVMLLTSTVFFVIKAFVTFMAASIGTLYFAQLLQFGAFAVFTPASVYYINQSLPLDKRGIGQALLGSATLGLGGAFGNMIGGTIVEYIGIQAMLLTTVVLSALGVIFMWIAVYVQGDRKNIELT